MLTALATKNAAPREKDYKIADSGGLNLSVFKTGHKVSNRSIASAAKSGV